MNLFVVVLITKSSNTIYSNAAALSVYVINLIGPLNSQNNFEKKYNLFGTQGSQYNTQKRLIEKRVLFKSPPFLLFSSPNWKAHPLLPFNGKKRKIEEKELLSSEKKTIRIAMAFASLKDVFDLPTFLSGLRHHPLYHSMGPYPYSLLTTADVPQFSPWWVELIIFGFYNYITGGPRHMRSFYLGFCIYAIEKWPFFWNLSSNLQ
jgi:hypothetical protein